jgi:hypothetical protein
LSFIKKHFFSEPSGQLIVPIVNINTDSPTVSTVNQVIAMPIDNTSLSSSNTTDSSKKSTDNLLN